LAGEATVEASPTVPRSYPFQVAYYDDGFGAFRLLNDSPRYRVNLMLNRFLFLMLPLLHDSGFACRTSEPEVVASRPSNLFPIELWFAILDGCGELPYAHVNGEDRRVLSFKMRLLLDCDVHVPVVAVSDQFAFSQLMFQKWLLRVG
jgi:hypothetical protein